ncbi:hypothetical protein ACKKBF_B39600 [Auxenochlorella protothecoides x Auxenochlorella symbiontica]
MGVVLRKASEFQARGHLLMLQGVEPLLNLLKSGSMNTPASLFLVTGERGGMHVPRDAVGFMKPARLPYLLISLYGRRWNIQQ